MFEREPLLKPMGNDLGNPLIKFDITPPEKVDEALGIEDLTSDGSTHAINLVRTAVQKELARRGFPNITVIRGNPVVSVEDNFDRLRFPGDNIGRSSTYTRYVDHDRVLRTHTSALVPSTLDELAARPEVEDITYIFPGLVFRRDVSDTTHLGVFHQMDIWRIQKNRNRRPMNEEDLLELVETVFRGAAPGAEPVIYPAEHPYTLNGIEVYAKIGDDELEVLEAGLAHPEVLDASGLNPERYSGLALGMGLDRLVMARKKIPDIRFLRAENPKIASQMHDLREYENVSNQPALFRDISYSVPMDATPEDISEWLRDAFGEDSYLIEEVDVLETTLPKDLHPNAKKRLGILEDQKNILVRITLRHPDRTLTKKEANKMYAEAYPKIHFGTEEGYI